jgi:rubrerythrin
MYDFNADDVFEMAEQLERNGGKFYRSAMEKVDDEENKNLLRMLAEMEDTHEKTFIAMRAELTASDKASTVFDPADESFLYLRALVDTRVFFEKEIDVSSTREILKSAIQAEKDAIVFFLGMKEAVPTDKGKGQLEAIIKEEMEHIRLLGGQLANLKK